MIKKLSQKKSDNELIQAYLNGDAKAFDTLYKRYLGFLITIAKAYAWDKCLVKDYVQDTWLKAVSSFDKFDGKNFKSWISRIAINICIDRYRQKMRRPTDYENTFPTISYTNNMSYIKDKEEKLALVLEKIKLLNPTQKDVILLRMKDVDYKVIMQKLDKPLGTCLSAFRVGVNRIKKLIEQDENEE